VEGEGKGREEGKRNGTGGTDPLSQIPGSALMEYVYYFTHDIKDEEPNSVYDHSWILYSE